MRASSFQKGIGMKNFKIRAALTGLVAVTLVAMAPQVSAQTVFVGDVGMTNSSPVTGSPGWVLTQSIPSGKGLFGVSIETVQTDSAVNTYQFRTYAIAEQYSVYSASTGDLIDASFASNTPPIATNVYPRPVLGTTNFSLALGESKRFAYWDDRSAFSSGMAGALVPDVGDSFGWVEFTRTSQGLVASASATVTGGSIRVGSFTAAVPEPETWALFALGLAGLSVVMRRI
jgi:PEP-CTERM motif